MVPMKHEVAGNYLVLCAEKSYKVLLEAQCSSNVQNSSPLGGNFIPYKIEYIYRM
jgi:hypothetical protein